MQKMLKLVFLFPLYFICLAVNAQKEKETVTEKKNIVKINLPALVFKNISLQYERKVGKRTSVAAGVRFIPLGKLPFQNTFKDLGNNSDVQYDQFKLGSFGIVPEFRYYVGKKGALHGFYIGPFFSYTNYKMNLPIKYNTKTGIFNGELKAITGGLQFGAQFSLGKNVVLDWWILGPNYGSATGTLAFSATLTAQEQSDLKTELENLKNDAPLNTIKSYTVNSSGASVVAKGPWGGLRGLGFSLGFKF
ncbi:MAG: hypothetical protein JWO92_941 [Chitinophagaceae bacterium]|nr:hypothetical protein [Chitinophagaceae bacterium]